MPSTDLDREDLTPSLPLQSSSTNNPFADRDVLFSSQSGLSLAVEAEGSRIDEEMNLHLNFAREMGHPVDPPARVLDFGCGIGSSVKALRARGYDAQGADVFEYWGRDFDLYWNARERPTGDYVQHLHVMGSNPYRLPFPDKYFDFAISNEVFEHVFNYPETFAEVARVLKPGAISVHRFPGPNYPIEGHINVPIAPLCRYRPYLALWALAGRRSARQAGLGWRETVEANEKIMKLATYPTKAHLRREAAKAGVRIEFMERKDLELRTSGRAAKLRDLAPRPFRNLWLRCLALVAQRYLVIYPASRS